MGLGPCFCGSYSGLTTGVLVLLGSESRLVYSMARDGLMPSSFSKVSDSGVPRRAVVCVWIVGGLIAGFVPIDRIAELYVYLFVGLFHGFTYGYSTEEKSTGTEKGLQDAIGTFRTGDVHGAVRFPGVPAGSSDMGGLRHMVLLRNDSLFPLRQETQ